ncbi:MAG: bifunctional riboflavin kinase/FAD synthetase [Gammaproteobacteria bacterium]|nr:bifunctional riboflavin kinase/FAD synthetase [Gammaproteobacteria bacterium]MDH3553883.1 bifunctional riboflavin kinase/FAD synthetase [Gammaproteobacteria bacterium]
MRLVRHLIDMPFDTLANGSVVTIGAYDGLHPGHEHLLGRVIAASRELNLPSLVMSFEPTPREFFSADAPPARLMRFREKFDALAAHGIEIFYCPRFAEGMRDISADDFIRRILIHGLCTRHLVIGDDFHFARRREGSIQQLRRACSALDYTVEQVPSVFVDGVRVSSTAIREALAAGEMQRATALLGRPYRMSGKIVKGKKVGRTLGYPTANVDLRRRQSAVLGIFAVRVSGLAGGPKDAVASVGTRPTFAGTKPLLEVHIFDFDEDIYGEYIHVDFIARLRSEVKYDAVEELVAQMHRDADNARLALAAAG